MRITFHSVIFLLILLLAGSCAPESDENREEISVTQEYIPALSIPNEAALRSQFDTLLTKFVRDTFNDTVVYLHKFWYESGVDPIGFTVVAMHMSPRPGIVISAREGSEATVSYFYSNVGEDNERKGSLQSAYHRHLFYGPATSRFISFLLGESEADIFVTAYSSVTTFETYTVSKHDVKAAKEVLELMDMMNRAKEHDIEL